jgi:MFS family permease
VTEGLAPHARRDDPDALLDATADPAGFAFGTTGSEASVDLNWIRLLRHRVQKRAAGSSRHEWWVMWSLLAGLLALNFTFTVFNLTLTTVAGQFHTSITVLTWTLTGPLLAYGIAAPVFGRIGDIFGHRRLYLFGLIGAMVSAILTALAPDTALLLFARTLDGVQGAATGTASGALLNLVFRPEDRVKAMGWWSLVGAGGPVIGLSIGAPIIAAFGWRALFWIQLVMLAVAFVVVTILLPNVRARASDESTERAEARRNFRATDWVGSWALSIGVTTLMLGLSLGTIIGWTSPGCVISWTCAAACGVVFVYRIRHVDNPLIPPHYFTRRNFIMPMIVRMVANFAYFGGFFLSPLLLEVGYHYSTGQSGAIVSGRPIAFALCSLAAGYVAIRVGERASAVAGTACLTLSMLLFALLRPSSGDAFIVLALVLSGMGMGVAMPSSSSTMANEVDPSEFGVMSAAQLLAMQVGEVAGIQVLVSIQQRLEHSRGLTKSSAPAQLLATFHIPFMIGTAAAFISMVFAWFFRSFDRSGLRRDRAEAADHLT